MKIVIRPYHSADLKPVMQLFHDTIHTINSRDYSPEQITTWAPETMDQKLWDQRLSNSHTLIADINGIIVGFCNFEGTGYLDCFYCHKDYQRMQVGTTLITKLEASAHSQGIIRIFSEVSITAQPFFLRHGYNIITEQHKIHRGVMFINYRMEKYLSS